ncbi:MAG: dTDP-4-dehydrorhamnose reductase [Alphaproteobacteria bacterium]|nr:dTDP-4-dehydrorhamnose reductase [Alphaproteobacteria bacterium]
MADGPILITGGSGQLARALDKAARAAGVAAVRVGRPEFDFDRPDSLDTLTRHHAPALVVNAAAYTAVDAAETDEAAAYRANRDGPARLASLAAAAGIPLLHVSTDFVFDGRKGEPYVESDPASPQGVYGASKLAGERAVLDSGARATVLRTSWVYGAQGKNFVLTMLNAARRTDRLRVVADQKGCPTAASDLAQAIVAIAARLRQTGWQDGYAGIFHAAGTGSTTWHGFAEAIFANAARHGVKPPVVEPIATADWPTPTRRPADSRLDCAKLAATFGVRLPEWQGSLSRTIDEIHAGTA